MARAPELMCPSADPGGVGATLFGLIVGTPDRPETAYLDTAQAVTPELLALAEPASPTEVFRFGSRCIAKACGHFDHDREMCRFGEKTVRMAPVVVNQLPTCAIRSSCRWWHQHAEAACLRCPQVVRTCFNADSPVRQAADPRVL